MIDRKTLRIHSISCPSGWLPLHTPVIVIGEVGNARFGKIAGYGETPDGEAYYRVNIGHASIWRRPFDLEMRDE